MSPFDFSTLQTSWDEEAEFPTLQEYQSSSGGGQDWPEVDEIEDGQYQLAVIGMTPPFENKYPDPRAKNPKPVRLIYFVIVDADDPVDIGKVVKKRVTFSGHPKSNAYPFLEAAYGGTIPADVRPSFSQLEGKQIAAFIANKVGPSGNPYQKWEAVRAVKPDRYKDVVPF